MWIGMTTNEYGTPVSKHKCDTCGNEYTCCPPLAEGDDYTLSANCEADGCTSYDPAGDCDILFMTDEEIAREKPQVCIDMLRARKQGNITRNPIKTDK